jgi:hypothetical protein
MRPISPSRVDSYLRAQTQITPLKPVETTETVLSDQSPEVTSPEPSQIDPPENSQSIPPENSQSIPIQTQSPQIQTPQVSASTDSTTFLETIAQTIEFKEEEFQLLVNCCKHVDITPRTAKRLINIYKILQIIWSTRSPKTSTVPTDEDDRNKRIITMSFLALSGRYPTYMRNLFEEIDVLFEETVDEDKPLEIYLEELLKPIQPTATQNDRYAHREWRKFNSDIKRMLEQDEANPSKLTIDRDVFDLMLSFCFVGDIGYDPDDFESKV